MENEELITHRLNAQDEHLKNNDEKLKKLDEEIKEFNLLKFQLSHLNDLLKEKTMKATVKNLTALRLVINSMAHNYNISKFNYQQINYHSLSSGNV